MLDVTIANDHIKSKWVEIFETDQRNRLRIKAPWPNKVDQEFQIIDIKWDKDHERSIGKAAAGAIVGGLLTGGLGAIAGGAVGGRKKDISAAVITLDIDGDQVPLYVKCSAKQYETLISLLIPKKS